jgi:FPC/CPF motif-containing protein YcgG
MRIYPVEGDSAVFELERGGEVFAATWLDGIDPSAQGAARIASARVMVRFYGDPDGDDTTEGHRSLLVAFLTDGRTWLLDNEQGRQPE